MSLTYLDFMFSILMVICNNIHFKVFDHVTISKFFKIYSFVTYSFVFIFIG